MNSKKVNWIFLSIISLHIIVLLVLTFLKSVYQMGMLTNFIVSELILVIPAFGIVLMSKEKLKNLFQFKKIKITSILMIILVVYLSDPLVTAINGFSMLFTDNAVNQMSGQILNLPFVVSFFFIAILAPVCEELIFRGIIYSGYRKSGNILRAGLFSAILFSLMHMNINQACYAFVIGILLVLLKEVTGSLWAPIIYHVVFNGKMVIMLYASESLLTELGVNSQMAVEVVTSESLMVAACIMSVIAVFTSAIAACVLYWIAKNEGRLAIIKEAWTERKGAKGTILSVSLIIAFILAIIFMLITV